MAAPREYIALRDASMQEYLGPHAPTLGLCTEISPGRATLAIHWAGASGQIVLDGAQVKALADALAKVNEVIGIDASSEGSE